MLYVILSCYNIRPFRLARMYICSRFCFMQCLKTGRRVSMSICCMERQAGSSCRKLRFAVSDLRCVVRVLHSCLMAHQAFQQPGAMDQQGPAAAGQICRGCIIQSLHTI
jgi:hypothetical protein